MTAFFSRGLVELTTGNPATSTTSPGEQVDALFGLDQRRAGLVADVDLVSHVRAIASAS